MDIEIDAIHVHHGGVAAAQVWPLRETIAVDAPKENGVVPPTGQEIERGVMLKLVTAQQLVQPEPQVAVETL